MANPSSANPEQNDFGNFGGRRADEPQEWSIARGKFAEQAWPVLKPEAQALAARATYLAVTDQLVVDNLAIQRALLKTDSPVAQQLLKRWQLMEEHDWTIQKRASTNANFGASYVRDQKLVNYAPQTKAIHNLGGVQGGLAEAVSQVAHELSHHDGHYWYPIGSGDAGANVSMAKRILSTEARAILTQTHVLQSMNASAAEMGSLATAITAIKNNDLGGHIHRTWPDWSIDMAKIDELYKNPVNPQFRYARMTYPEFRFLSEQQAREHVNQYISETFGKDLFDPKTGKIRAFDINAGIGEMNVPLHPGENPHPPFGEKYRWIPDNNERVKRPILDPLDRKLAGTNRALQTLGALGALSITGDVATKYSEGFAAGTGHLGKIATTWGAFEVASRVSNIAIGRRAGPGVKLASALGLGAVASYAADRFVGPGVKESIKNAFER